MNGIRAEGVAKAAMKMRAEIKNQDAPQAWPPEVKPEVDHFQGQSWYSCVIHLKAPMILLMHSRESSSFCVHLVMTWYMPVTRGKTRHVLFTDRID